MLALLCSTVAWASLPRPEELSTDEQRQWQALGVAPLSSGGATGVAMAPTEAAQSIPFAPRRAPAIQVTPQPQQASMLASKVASGITSKQESGHEIQHRLHFTQVSKSITRRIVRVVNFLKYGLRSGT